MGEEKRGRPKRDFTKTEEAILLYIARHGATFYKKLYAEKVGSKRAVRQAKDALLKKGLLKVKETKELFTIKPLDLTFTGVLYVLSKIDDDEIAEQIVIKYKNYPFLDDAAYLLKTDKSAGLWWIKALKRTCSFLKVWKMDQEIINVFLTIGLLKEASEAPPEIKKNPRIQNFAEIYSILTALYELAMRKIPIEEKTSKMSETLLGFFSKFLASQI